MQVEYLQMPIDPVNILQDEKTLNMALGQRLKTFRVVAGKKQKDLAEVMDFSPNYLSMVEAGRREPSLKFLRRFSSALRVPLSVIFLHEKGTDDALNSPPKVYVELAREVDLINEILLRERYPEDSE